MRFIHSQVLIVSNIDQVGLYNGRPSSSQVQSRDVRQGQCLVKHSMNLPQNQAGS